MTIPETKYHHGQQVIVLDENGQYLSRGAIVGVHRIVPTCYDILPRGEMSLSKAKHGIPEGRLRVVARPALAYERGPLAEAVHILDNA